MPTKGKKNGMVEPATPRDSHEIWKRDLYAILDRFGEGFHSMRLDQKLV